jgi:GNAT superfamily N-acetyltransferase
MEHPMIQSSDAGSPKGSPGNPGSAEPLLIRRATEADVPEIVRLLAADPLGAQREESATPLPAAYLAAFEAIAEDPNHELIVVEASGAVIGTLHLIVIPSISYRGGKRAQLESVHVDRAYRGQGIGSELCLWAIERARALGCRLVQLTSHGQRADAHRFYTRLGFAASHVGMKIDLHAVYE